MLTRNELISPVEGSHVCANFGKNRSTNATVRVRCEQTNTLTDANRFYNLPHVVYYNYGTDN